jgi:hypothetical protein
VRQVHGNGELDRDLGIFAAAHHGTAATRLADDVSSEGKTHLSLCGTGKPPHSGIYKCTGCGHEIVAEQDRQFPPQNHHQHPVSQGKIRWKLIVFADHESKRV